MLGFGHDSARDAGQRVARLRESAGSGLSDGDGGVRLDGELLGVLAPDASLEQVREARAALADAAA